MVPANFILVRCTLADAGALAQAARDFCVASSRPMRLHRAAFSDATGLAYVYAALAPDASADAAHCQALAARWRQVCSGAADVDVSRLRILFDAPGASRAQAPVFHYVVETDTEEGWADEIDRWYDTEHMPGLAAVPGCISARRLRNLDSGPQSLACYDLVTQETLGSPPWLAVRGTAWSDIARPHFVNTRRTMMRVVA